MVDRMLCRAAFVVAACLAGAAPASAAGIRIAQAKCVPADHCQANARYVAPAGKLLLTGSGLQRGQLVVFVRKANKKRTITSKLRKSRQGLVVVVPPAAGSGRIRVVDKFGRRSNAYGPIHVVKPPPPVAPPTPSGTVFDGSGMWIWYLNKSARGSSSTARSRPTRPTWPRGHSSPAPSAW
jgi:hypothetical protein